MTSRASLKAKQQQAAQLLLALWAWTALLLPLSHSWQHELDHVHGPHGLIRYFVPPAKDAGAEHHHGHSHHSAHTHHHQSASAKQSQTRQKRAANDPPEQAQATHKQKGRSQDKHAPHKHPVDPSHGEGSAAHFQATFWSQFSEILPASLLEELPEVPPARAKNTAPSSPHLWLRRSRAPPSA